MRKQLMGAAIAAVIAAPAMADDHSNKWYLNAGVGYQVFDSAWDLEETAAALFSVEQKLSKDWGVEVGVSYADADNRYNNSAADAEVTFISANAIRYYNTESKIEPYAAIGLGMGVVNFDVVREEEITQANLGGGFRYALSGPLSLHVPTRLRAR